MSNETKNMEELSKPVAWSYEYATEGSENFTGFITRRKPSPLEIVSGEVRDIAPLYSEECVNALLARIAELERERDANDEAALAVRDAMRNRIAELEQKLATPVRLPQLCGDGDNDTEYTEGLNDGITQSAIYLRRQDFKVEGDA